MIDTPSAGGTDRPCSTCNGEGRVYPEYTKTGLANNEQMRAETCPTCNGSGRPPLCLAADLARLRHIQERNIAMGLEVGQILGPSYDGADFRAIARELVSTKADLARLRRELRRGDDRSASRPRAHDRSDLSSIADAGAGSPAPSEVHRLRAILAAERDRHQAKNHGGHFDNRCTVCEALELVGPNPVEALTAEIARLRRELEEAKRKWEPAKHSLGAAWKERAAAAERRIASLCDAHEEAFVRAEKADAALSRLTAAVTQATKEMRWIGTEQPYLNHPTRYVDAILQWADALAAAQPAEKGT